MFSTLQGIAAIVIFFGGSIFVHELGHFLSARWRGIRVIRFSIGFGPRLFVWKSRRSGIEYCLSLLPLGGYVALPDLASMSAIEGGVPEGSAIGNFKKPEEITYLDRVIVLSAGAVFNVLFAVILAFVAWAIPMEVAADANTTQVGNVSKTLAVEPGVEIPGPAFEAGIEIFDRIVAVDGEPVDDFSDLSLAIAFGTGRDDAGAPRAVLTVENAAGTREVAVSPALVATNARVGDRLRRLGMEPVQALRIVPQEDGAAAKAGLLAGDIITAADGVRLGNVSHFVEILRSREATAPLRLDFLREGEAMTAVVEPQAIVRLAPTAVLALDFGDEVQTVHILPTPLELENISLSAPRDTLRTYLAGTKDFPVGTIIDAVGVDPQSAFVPLKSLEDLAGTLSLLPEKKPLRFVLTYPDGNSKVLAGTLKSFLLVPGKEESHIGVAFHPLTEERHISPLDSLVKSVDLTFRSLAGLVNPGSDIGIGHMNGVFSIGEVYYKFSKSLYLLLSLTVIINVNLAILNLLPVPVLDGGHILIATVNRLRRRPLGLKTQASITMVFMFLLFIFMAYVLLNDWARVRGNREVDRAANLERFEYSNEYLKLIKK
ncbi:MAG: site-2 protease family protein [Opitutales bacterium]|nr:site-2 protease family protein [Opitutales bacterium]